MKVQCNFLAETYENGNWKDSEDMPQPTHWRWHLFGSVVYQFFLVKKVQILKRFSPYFHPFFTCYPVTVSKVSFSSLSLHDFTLDFFSETPLEKSRTSLYSNHRKTESGKEKSGLVWKVSALICLASQLGSHTKMHVWTWLKRWMVKRYYLRVDTRQARGFFFTREEGTLWRHAN